jgi:hypothetical protein
MNVHGCPVTGCKRRYAYKGDLKVHIRRQHVAEAPTLLPLVSPPRSTRVDKEFGCPYTTCPCGFTGERGLARHLRYKHKGRLPTPPPPPPPAEEDDNFSSVSPDLSDG